MSLPNRRLSRSGPGGSPEGLERRTAEAADAPGVRRRVRGWFGVTVALPATALWGEAIPYHYCE